MEICIHTNGSRIPAAQHEGLVIACLRYLCLRVRLLEEEDEEEQGDVTQNKRREDAE